MSLDPDAPAGAEPTPDDDASAPAGVGSSTSPTPGGAETEPSGSGWWLAFIERYALVGLFALTFLFFSTWSKTWSAFRSWANIQNVLSSQAVVGILAMAIIIPLTCGEFDFSVGSIAGLTQVLCAGFLTRLGWPVGLAILVPIAIGAFVGLSNGNTVARIGVNSLIVTLGVSTVLAGIVEWYTSGQSILISTSPSW